LWPQPRANAYCGVSDTDKGIDRNKRWHLLAPLKLSQETATKLAFVMPAVVSNLQRHEWIKHGTCYGADAETYYSDAILLTQQINDSIVGKLFNKGVGKKVSLKQVRQHFDKAFGKGSGKKVSMRCDKKGRVSELWINLKGRIDKGTKISTLLNNSVIAGRSCKVGLIDRANR
jgi:ribonuclease T2